MTRALIVNADDFGRSPGINRGVVHAHEQGIVTSASLMVRWPAARQAADYSRPHPDLSVGLHLDLGEWVYRSGGWEPRYEVVATDDAEAVSQEVERQLQLFRRLVGGDPTHLDSHQHVHRQAPAAAVVEENGRRLGVPVREFAGGIRYCGDFHGQTGRGEPWPDGITVESLLRILDRLPDGVTELGCHPGLGDDADSVYGRERAREVAALCDPRVRVALEDHDIQLRSFQGPALT